MELNRYIILIITCLALIILLTYLGIHFKKLYFRIICVVVVVACVAVLGYCVYGTFNLTMRL